MLNPQHPSELEQHAGATPVRSMTHIDSERHVTGRSLYIDDIPLPQGTLYAHVYYVSAAHAEILSVHTEAARAHPGVVRILTAADIPGVNQIGGVIEDEPLFADGHVHYWGQPLALIVAESLRAAREASLLISVKLRLLPVTIDPRVAAAAGKLLFPPVCFTRGDASAALAKAELVVRGRADTGGQEHLYLEPQGAIAWPCEGGGVHITSSTQGPTAVQRTAARVLGLAMHQVEVDVRRLGGAFGGKEDQATPWAVMAALAAVSLQRPVKLVLHRVDDMRMTGKRHPYSSDFELGLNRDGLILAYRVHYYQNGGSATDLSPGVLSRTLFHAANTYYIPHVDAHGYSCRTNLPPNTAFRGFGGPQGMFVIEAAIRQAAEKLGLDPAVIQAKNLLREGDEFHYGQKARLCQARSAWQQLHERFKPEASRAEIAAYNAAHASTKRGMAFMPICFGISFTKTPMNQASALVHIYQDGSVSVSTAAVEMGQGVSTKIVQVAAETLGLPSERIHVMSTNTSRVANTSPTAASSGADLNGHATRAACLILQERLLKLARTLLPGAGTLTLGGGGLLADGAPSQLSWADLIARAYLARVSLSAQAHFATPHLHFDLSTAKGSPFAYHVYGASFTEVTLDCLRGRYTVDRVALVHDFGESLNWQIDLGQVEGALMQGIAWLTLEELQFTGEGRPLTDTLSTYKIPDIYAAPRSVEVEALCNALNPAGIFQSKAVGEPPLMYGIGTFFALREAMRAYAPQRELAFTAPLTPERVLMQLYDPLSG